MVGHIYEVVKTFVCITVW